MNFTEQFDVVVIGGGHAGTEAALASARMGASTLLVTQSIETIGQMSCNPAIGGIGKTHLVREVDALGGAMALATDRAGIHFRTLNASKGPAVQALRAQTDRALYKAAIREIVEQQNGLKIFQDSVVDLELVDDRVQNILTRTGIRISARTVVLTTGTFLGGRIFIGHEQHEGGRAGDPPSNVLAQRLRALPFRVNRLKTGTPPRLDGRTVDYSQLEIQPGDGNNTVFSYIENVKSHPEQRPCYITHTNRTTHDIIRQSVEDSPMFSGAIEGIGPRYCPSIEDKVVRFAERNQHQIFVEPEGLNTTELYPNGISTSLPFNIQQEFVRSIRGFANTHITRPGYAIEYDFFDPRDLEPTLQTKQIENLFLAGQINGTTGYEEAAAQGLLAGLNASLQAADKSGWYPRRHEAYLGVLVDDLTSFGTNEPYRMFTSRAEFRLRLRQDNADQRLTPIGHELGLVSNERWQQFQQKYQTISRVKEQLQQTVIQPKDSRVPKLEQETGESISREVHLVDFVKRPSVTVSAIQRAGWLQDVDGKIAEQAAIDIKYEGYIARQDQEIKKAKAAERMTIPVPFNYTEISGLSSELRQKLSESQPKSMASAAKIPGITPAALALLAIYVKRNREQRKIA
ncbi:MAG: tRNA uridine-5-carboxymethylaminomethyl(34) synthesis enzyme MnmG [Gammaproteobacteria bacterium]|nr:tRNA uridine-5-carboxymethylaminomethyl(34) synthesis enzyme MnmG [Gammaproteobacteria bacterium]MYI76864.1 tRNA uridine-5-carboxymethylaminomethyl(34) synthesis enzyme MnmG [Gammaproteobacteria bacterium]